MRPYHWIVLFGLLPWAIVAVTGCGGQEAANGDEDGIPVRAEHVAYRPVSIPVHTSGKLVSAAEARLSFKVGGIVESIIVREGQAVEKGRLLAELKTDEIDARVEQARSTYEKARRDFERAQRLYDDSVATLEQLQDAETGLRVAESALEIAKFNQDHAAISAPTGGKILKRFVEEGELVGSGTPILLFGSGDGGWAVRAGVSDRDIIRLAIGDSASVGFDAYPGVHFPATVTEIGKAADPLSGAYEVELAVDDMNHEIVSGFVAKVDIFPVRCDTMFVVPIEALMEADADAGYVYAPDETGKVAERFRVRIGCIFGDKVAVTSGLEGVSQVITEGAAYLKDGSAVRVVDENELGG
jgi:RND family efflux transporter MFP subunit